MQFSKNFVDRLVENVGARFGREWHVGTAFYAYVVAVAILVAAQAFMGVLSVQQAFLDVFNGLLVVMATKAMADDGSRARETTLEPFDPSIFAHLTEPQTSDGSDLTKETVVRGFAPHIDDEAQDAPASTESK